jgi:uncharacterized coiled-coil protein SlyX
MEEIMDFPMRKYNYRLETGAVGTNDDDIACFLYNINQIEMYTPFSFNNIEEFKKAFSQLTFHTFKAREGLNKFFENFKMKLKIETSDEVIKELENVTSKLAFVFGIILKQTIDENNEYILNGEPNMERISRLFNELYSKLLNIVPKIIELDDQSVGRV